MPTDTMLLNQKNFSNLNVKQKIQEEGFTRGSQDFKFEMSGTCIPDDVILNGQTFVSRIGAPGFTGGVAVLASRRSRSGPDEEGDGDGEKDEDDDAYEAEHDEQRAVLGRAVAGLFRVWNQCDSDRDLFCSVGYCMSF